MNKQPLSYYIERYLEGNITSEEWATLKELTDIPENERVLSSLMDEQIASRVNAATSYPGVMERIKAGLKSRLEEERIKDAATPRTRLMPRSRYWIAAASVLLLLIGVYFLYDHAQQRAASREKDGMLADIDPGKEGAVLTLANGSRVVLDSLGNGVIATQNGSQVSLHNGQLVYAAAGDAGQDVAYNIMTTPKGRQFSLRLPDGTKVWLNAASSLRYPTQFYGAERRVEVSGEAYFEVVKNENQPFYVRINNQAEVRVLGTSFNVNAYSDASDILTTLVEGSVKINALQQGNTATGGSTRIASAKEKVKPGVVLKPGQQAQIGNSQRVANDAGGEIKVMNNVDMEKVIAWKEGVFNFNGTGIEEVMRQLSRWYDIEVIYEGEIPAITFFGKMSRNIKLAGLLKALEESEVHFRIEEGRKLVVMP